MRFDFFTTEDDCLPVAAEAIARCLTSESCYDVSGEASEDFPELAVPDRDRCDFDPMPEGAVPNFAQPQSGDWDP